MNTVVLVINLILLRVYDSGDSSNEFGSQDCGRNEQQIIYCIYYPFVVHALNPKSKTCWTF